MARIRSIKPEFWSDEKLAPMDPLTRLVFIGLWNLADDEGRLIDSIKTIDGLLFPETDDSCREALAKLSRSSRVIRYRDSKGRQLIQVANWQKHQKIDHPKPSNFDPPSESDYAQKQDSETLRENLAKPSRSFAKSERLEHGEQGSRGAGEQEEPPTGVMRVREKGRLSKTALTSDPLASQKLSLRVAFRGSGIMAGTDEKLTAAILESVQSDEFEAFILDAPRVVAWFKALPEDERPKWTMGRLLREYGAIKGFLAPVASRPRLEYTC
ncbi:MAG: hypothetical protein KGL39_45940 [Patescibacteria group bacterium]|nr:hypothetical protein [Patescibacteria group bacterium]